MPLLRAEVRSEYALGAPELYREANREDPKEILEGVAVAGLVGVLRQLGDLADFAAEVFHGLQEEVAVTSSRSHKLMARVHRVEAALSPLERAILSQRSHLHFAYTAGSDWHAHIRCEQNHFVYSDVPQFIMDSYEDCRSPPRLHLLDKFDPGGPGSCLKRYSDPTFFKRASSEYGGVNAEKLLKEKKGRKIRLKRRSWSRNEETSRGASFSFHSGRMEFIPRNIGARASSSQTASTNDGPLKSDFGEQSNFDIRNGPHYVEDDFRPSYSTQPEEQESGASISSPVKRNDSDFLDYNFLDGKVPDAFNDTQVTQLQELAGGSSSSITWDEKKETPKPVSQDYDHEGMSHEDELGRNLESPSRTVDLETLVDTVNFGTVDDVDFQPCNLALPTVAISSDTHLDEVESETDQFMDALNTIESESESDLDCMKKKEIDHSCTLEDRKVDNGVCEVIRNNSELHNSNSESILIANGSIMNGYCGRDPSMVPTIPPAEAYHSSSGCIDIENGLSSDTPSAPYPANGVVAVENERKSILPSAAYPYTCGLAVEHEDKSDFPVNKVSPVVESIESPNPASLRSIDSPKNDDSEIDTPITYNIRDDEKPGVLITDESRSSNESEKPADQNSTVTSVTVWTNGGLLGLQPSKPPDFSVLNAPPENPMTNHEKSRSSTMHFAVGDKDSGKGDIAENLKNLEKGPNLNHLILQESDAPFRKPSWKISPADLDVKLGISGGLLNLTNANSTGMVSGKFVTVNPAFDARKHQENSKNSSRMYELSNRLLTTGSSKRLLPGGIENSVPASSQTATAFDQKNRQNVAHRIFSAQSKDILGGDSLVLSPSSSPPLEHMKVSFQPLGGFETSKLKLKFPDRNSDNESSRDIFPSFQLVPELSTTRHNVDLDSDDDTFYRSSPSLSDDCHSHQSDSNSEQWESGESPSTKDHELYDTLRRMSLTESVSSATENGWTRHEDINGNCGHVLASADDSIQNSQSCRSFDVQSLEMLNHSFREELKNSINLKHHMEPHVAASPAPPPQPPVQWRVVTPHLDDMEKCEATPEGSNYIFDVKISESMISQQPKPAPLHHEQSFKATDAQKSKQFSKHKANGGREDNQMKNMDENDFLHQIRTKSFNLRPTLKAKLNGQSTGSASVQVTAIIEKANAIRPAVGSDDDGTWSDT